MAHRLMLRPRALHLIPLRRHQHFLSGGPICIKLSTPDDPTPEKMTRFGGPTCLGEFVKSFGGTLYGPLDLPTEGFIEDYCEVAPGQSYKIISPPMFRAFHEERRHCQISDLAYEQKCRHAMTEYLRAADPVFTELPRKIYSDHKVLAEWKGVYEKGDGSVVFLEVKHRMTWDVIVDQKARMEKSMKGMNKSGSAVVFLAGRDWDDEDRTVDLVKRFGHGAIFESGNDLSIIPPGPSSFITGPPVAGLSISP